MAPAGVHEDVARLHALVDEVVGKVEELALLRPEGDLAPRLEALRALHRALRERWSHLLDPPVQTRRELATRVAGADLRSRVTSMGRYLRAGEVSARSPREHFTYERRRKDAVQELDAVAEAADLPRLPGPVTDDPDRWVRWAWDAEPEDVFNQLKEGYPALAEFVLSVPRQAWLPSAPPAVEQDALPVEEDVDEPMESAPVEDAEATEEPAVEAQSPLEVEARAAPIEAPVQQRPRSTAGRPRAPAPAREGSPRRPLSGGLFSVLRAVGDEVTAEVPAPPPPGPAPDAPPEFPDRLRTFKGFRDSHWIESGGRCGPAPWTDEGFHEDLMAGVARCARGLRLFEAEVMVRAQQKLERSPTFFAEDLASLGHLLGRADARQAGWDEARRAAIELAYEEGAIEEKPAWRLRILLEYLRPAPSHGGLPPHKTTAVDAGISGTWLAFAAELERLTQMGVELAAAWALREHADESDDQEDLDALRRTLRDTYTRLYSAAGGKVERTHCREAWAQFIEAVRPQLTPLFPLDAGGTDGWKPADVAKGLRRVPKLLQRIADSGGAKWSDRRSMEKGASELLDAATAVVEAARKAQNTPRPRQEPRANLEVVDAVLAQRADGVEFELVRRALRRVLGIDDVPVAISLPMEKLCATPELLELLPPQAVAATDTRVDVAARDVQDVVRASACLLRSSRSPTSEGGLVAAITRSGRHHLLPMLRGNLDELDRHRVENQQQQALDELLALQAELNALYVGLDHLGSVHAGPCKEVIDEAEELLDGDGHDDLRLVAGWLSDVRDVAAAALEAEKRAHLGRIDDGQTREAVRRLLETGAWAEVQRVLAPGDTTAHPRVVRDSMWRRDALARFPDPRKLGGHDNGVDRDLRDRWLEERPSSNRQRGLRSAFGEWVVGSALASEADKGATAWTLPTPSIRAALDAEGRNPSFLPQITRFSSLSIETMGTPADRHSFPNAAANHLGTADSSNPLRILLAPNLTERNREETLRQLHQRGSMAALVDDLDLCRLAQAQHDQRSGLIALLEIALEQLPLGQVDPFDGGDGQHVQPEMFVGRREEARDIALGREYTRLFSGRKLGKSALLRAIQQRHANKPLPDGTKLRVIYVPLVGTHREKDVVDEVAQRLKAELGITLTVQPDQEPRHRLRALLRELTEKRPSETFLFVCDEADQFVESQIEMFDRDTKESTLSWMIRQLEELPCRFLFAGYRATYRREGPWENWGTTLKLKPLQRAEAEDLIVKPLARIGIDATSHAHALARRCGYQPAILLRMGRALLDEVRRGGHGFDRPGVVVLPEQVSKAFTDRTVQDEISTVVRANFHGSPLAEVVFCACLLELAELPAGAYLDGARDRVLARLAVHRSDEDWVPDGRSAHAVVDAALLELVDRQLLARGSRSEGPGRYRLRFPHHLRVLLDVDPSRLLRERLTELAQGVGHHPPSSAGLLEPAEVVEVRELLDEAKGLGLAAVVLCSTWDRAIDDNNRNGMVGALDIDRQKVRVHHGCSPRQATQLVRTGEPALLTGGYELLEWALRVEAGAELEDVLLELHTLRRLSSATVGWWFRRARGIEFADTDGLQRIYQVTRGVPELVGLVDQTFPSEGGETISGNQLRQATDRVAAHLEAGGPNYLRATDREVLRVVLSLHDQLAPESSDPASLAREIQDALASPELLADMVREPDAALSPEVGMRIRVLQLVGWLPALPGGVFGPSAIGPIDSDDPVRSLVRV